MAQSTKNTVAGRNDDVNQQLSILREDIANLTAAITEYGKAQGQSLNATMAEKAANAGEAGAAAAAKAKAKAEVVYSDAETAIRENPATAIGIAAGLGFILGMIATRR